MKKKFTSTMLPKIGTNDLSSFKHNLASKESEVDEMVTMVDYHYDVQPVIYTLDCTNNLSQLNPSNMLTYMGMGTDMMSTMANSGVFTEMLDDEDTVKSQYKILEGRWPKKYNEVILILPSENEISDLLLYSLGLRDGADQNRYGLVQGDDPSHVLCLVGTADDAVGGDCKLCILL